MSTTRITTVTVICDTCADEKVTGELSAYASRIAAGIDGWRFAQGRKREPGSKGRREFDYCPACWPTSPHATGEL